MTPESVSQDVAEVGGSVRSSVHERAYRKLRTQLIEGQLTPGQTILAKDMAEAMAMSVTPVREAIQRLIGDGSLEPMPNGNARVRLFSETQLDEWWVLRTLLESLAVARAAERVDPPRLASIIAVNRQANTQLDAANVLEFGSLNRQFHFMCYALAGSPVLSNMIDSLWEKAGPYIVMAIPTYVRAHASGQPKQLMDPHDEILTALAQGDGSAAAMALRRDIGMTIKWKSLPVARLMQVAVAEVRAVRRDLRLIGPSSAELEEADSRPDIFQRSSSVVGSLSRTERRVTAQSKACRAIRDALIAGRFMPGEHITVRSLCEHLGLGAMPVREALREVASEGPLEKLENGRLRVRLFSEADRRDLLELRALLEAIAAGSAVQSARPSLVEKLVMLRDKMAKALIAGDSLRVRQASHAFVEVLCKGASLDLLTEVLGHVWLLTGPSVALFRHEMGPDLLVAWQEAVIAAMRKGEVQTVMRLVAARDAEEPLALPLTAA